MDNPAQLIRAMRERLNRTATDVATSAEGTVPAYHRFERSDNFTWQSLTRWVDALGASVTVTINHPSHTESESLVYGTYFRSLIGQEGGVPDLTAGLCRELPGTPAQVCRWLSLTIQYEMADEDLIASTIGIEEGPNGMPRRATLAPARFAQAEITAFQAACHLVRDNITRAIAKGEDHIVLAGELWEHPEDFITHHGKDARTPTGVKLSDLHEYLTWAKTISDDPQVAARFYASIGFGIVHTLDEKA